MSTSILEALPGKLDIKRHPPSILYVSLQLYLSSNGWPITTYLVRFNNTIYQIMLSYESKFEMNEIQMNIIGNNFF